MRSFLAAALIPLLAAALGACSTQESAETEATSAPPAPQSALTASRAQSGLKLARQWCSSCHTVESGGTGSDVAPPFADIAARRDSSWIKSWLADPHPPMPNLSLSNAEIDDLTAYIKSLTPTAP